MRLMTQERASMRRPTCGFDWLASAARAVRPLRPRATGLPATVEAPTIAFAWHRDAMRISTGLDGCTPSTLAHGCAGDAVRDST